MTQGLNNRPGICSPLVGHEGIAGVGCERIKRILVIKSSFPFRYQVYPTCRNTSGVLGFSVTVETQATKFSTEFVEAKIEEFLVSFGECLSGLSEEAFKTQVTALIKLKECEDAHLGEEVDRNWFEVVTQQYVFKRLNKEIEALKVFSQGELVSWFMEHRNGSSRRLSVHVVGFGVEENDPPEQSVCCSQDSPDSPPPPRHTGR
nr:nardilysin-like [Labrus bergylta]